uniref:IlGF domain-containing protein n=1 Tax=Macrostomum lignano TaxID=282301 RepID=A0A1I8FPG7_9PLAT
RARGRLAATRWPSLVANGRRRGLLGDKVGSLRDRPGRCRRPGWLSRNTHRLIFRSPQKLCSSSAQALLTPANQQDAADDAQLGTDALGSWSSWLWHCARSGSQQIRNRGPALGWLRTAGGVYNGGLMRRVRRDTTSSSVGQLLKRTIGHSKLKCLIPKDDIVHHCCTCGRCTLSYMQLYCNY